MNTQHSSTTELVKKKQTAAIEMGLVSVSALALLTVAAWMGKLPGFFEGEDFLVFNFANNFPLLSALENYIRIYGRPLEALYWTGMYKVFGYAPALHHFFSFFLHLAAVIAASLAIYRITPRNKYVVGSLATFAVFLFFFPQAINSALRLNSDNSRLAILLWLLSLLAAQEWAKTSFKVHWLAVSLLLQLLSIFAYDVTIFLFPVSLILALPLIRKPLVKVKKRMGIFLVGGFLLSFVPLAFYAWLGTGSERTITHPAFKHGFIDEITNRFADAIVFLPLRLFKLNEGMELSKFLPSGLFFAILLALTVYVGFLVTKAARSKAASLSTTPIALFIAALWILVLGMLPYVLAYPNEFTAPRYYSASIYGLAILVFLAFTIAKAAAVRWAVAGLAIASLVLGIVEFNLLSNYLSTREPPLENFFLSTKEVVPNVRDNTVFFYIDPGVRVIPSGTCALGLRMLYNRPNLSCAFLSYTNEEFRAIRKDGYIRAYDGLRNDTGYWIFLKWDENGQIAIVDIISPNSELLIDWESSAPMVSDLSRIRTDEASSSQMYRYLLLRKQSR
jgi:hypothetical protein